MVPSNKKKKLLIPALASWVLNEVMPIQYCKLKSPQIKQNVPSLNVPVPKVKI